MNACKKCYYVYGCLVPDKIIEISSIHVSAHYYCRRYPPKVYFGIVNGLWPRVNEDDFCGEFKEAEFFK